MVAVSLRKDDEMIDLYYWTTPNGHKITIYLEETGLAYQIKPINISTGEQFAPDFLRIAPNNRIPAIVDHNPSQGSEPISVFESGAILLYLADKTGHLIPDDLRRRTECLEWLFWQMAGLGPMLGQNHHFRHYAPEVVPYAVERYTKETSRLYAVLDKHLALREYICGDEYSIADIACYPWILPQNQGQDLSDYSHLARWHAMIAQRPAVIRAYDIAKQINTQPSVSDERSRQVLFGQGKDAVK